MAAAKSKPTNTMANVAATKETEDDAPVPSIDPALDEARQILGDLVTLTGKRSGLAVKP
jgi:hypothetical protein